ncbi:MAG: hypothetical protein ACOCXM_03240 [Myxococcota bacterium]
MTDLIHGWKGLQAYLEERYGWGLTLRWLHALAEDASDPLPVLPHRPRTPARFVRVDVDRWATRRLFGAEFQPEPDAIEEATFRVEALPSGGYVATCPTHAIRAEGRTTAEAMANAYAQAADYLQGMQDAARDARSEEDCSSVQSTPTDAKSAVG